MGQTGITTASFVVSATNSGPPGHNSQITLNYSSSPALTGLQVPPVFVPTQISGSQTSTITFQTGPSTPPGSYTITIGGIDDCTGAPPGPPQAQIALTVNGTAASPSPSPSPGARLGITGVLPGLICVNVTNPIQLTDRSETMSGTHRVRTYEGDV